MVLNVKSGHPGFPVFADSADHIDGVAVAGIGIGDSRDPDRLGGQPDKPVVACDFAVRRYGLFLENRKLKQRGMP
ncbi:MAG TPA: hypothetical protein VJX94_00225 [Stellaceae bacterium]|nr:hypothetical protein [Stellaceae bacterium]